MKAETIKTIKQFRKYRLSQFTEILDELFTHSGNLKSIEGFNILELGPGSKVNLMHFLLHEANLNKIIGAGRHPEWP